MSKIHRTKKVNNYTQLDNTVINDIELSWKAKGLHCYLMSLPDTWSLFLSDLSNRSKDGRDGTATALKELISAGYVTRIRVTDELNKFVGYDYNVFEKAENGKAENGKAENGKAENGKAENGKADANNNTGKKELIETITDVYTLSAGEENSISVKAPATVIPTGPAAYSDRPQPISDAHLAKQIIAFLNQPDDISNEFRRQVFEKIEMRCKSLKGKGMTLSGALNHVVEWWAARRFAKNLDLNLPYNRLISALKTDLDYFEGVQPTERPVSSPAGGQRKTDNKILTKYDENGVPI